MIGLARISGEVESIFNEFQKLLYSDLWYKLYIIVVLASVY
jgi:hypothetical protein